MRPKCILRNFLRTRWDATLRVRTYLVCGVSLTLIGLALMYITVDHVGINQYIAQALVVPPIMFVVSYYVHRQRTFGDRYYNDYSSHRRYTIVRLGGMGASRVGFILLVAVVGLPYLIASLLITAGLAGPTYLLNRDWAFENQSTNRRSFE